MPGILFLSFIAGIISAEITAFGQFMISRPIVVGPLFGFLLGDIKAGLWIGMIIELIWIGAIPMGAAIPNDITSIAILSTVWSLRSFPEHNATASIIAMMIAVPAGVLYRYLDIKQRYFNVHIVHWVEAGIEQGLEYRITIATYLGLLLFMVKGVVFYALMILAGEWLLKIIYFRMPQSLLLHLQWIWYLLPVAGFGVFLLNFRYEKLNVFKE